MYRPLPATKQRLWARHSAYFISTNPQRQCSDSHFIDEESEVSQRNHLPNVTWLVSSKAKIQTISVKLRTLEKPEK